MRVPPDCTKSSTMTTCLPLGDPSFSRTIRLSPSLTFVQITCAMQLTLSFGQLYLQDESMLRTSTPSHPQMEP